MMSRAEPLYLTEEEFRRFCTDLETLLEPLRAKSASPERQRLLFATIAIPDTPDPPAA